MDGERSFVAQGKQSVQASLQVKAGQVSVQLSARPRPTLLAVRAGAGKTATLDGVLLAQAAQLGGSAAAWQLASKPGLLWVYLPAGGAAALVLQ